MNENRILRLMQDSISKVMTENGVDYDIWRNWKKCGHVPFDDVALVYGGGRYWWEGICHCGSNLACPVCSRKIAEFRCREIREGIHRWKQMDKGNDVYLLTLTMSHNRFDDVAGCIEDIKKANQDFFRDSVVRDDLEDLGCVGKVTSFEIKWGVANGIHPHFHLALFARSGWDESMVESQFGDKWLKKLEMNGRTGFKKVACNVKCASHVHNYLTKMSSEMALGYITKLGGDHLTPLQLLYRYATDKGVFYGRTWSRIVTAMKGKSVIKWSLGLRDLLGMRDYKDEDIVEHHGVVEDVVIHLKDRRDLKLLSAEEMELIKQAVMVGRMDMVIDALHERKISFNENMAKKHINMNNIKDSV